MGRRRKLFKLPKIKSESVISGAAFIIILSGLLILVSVIGNSLGTYNFLAKFIVYVFGFTAWIIPFLVIICGIKLTSIRTIFSESRIIWGLVVLIVSIMLILGSIQSNFSGYLANSMVNSLSQYITRAGCGLLGFVLLMFALFLILNISLHDFFQTISNYLIERSKQKKNKENSNINQENIETKPIVNDTKTTQIDPQTKYISNPNEQKINSNIEIVEDQQDKKIILGEPENKNTNYSSTSNPTSTSEEDQIPYSPPPISILEQEQQKITDQDVIEKNARIIEATLSNFGIQARIAEVNLGPAVTQYAINLAEGTRSSKIISLQNDIALALASPTGSVRIESPIPGKHLIGIEVPNITLTVVRLKSILLSSVMQSDPSPLAVALGEDVSGQPVIAHVDKWPHILIAGSTGSGKSVLIHSIINSILFRATPEQVKLILVDPKRVELTQYNSIPHLETPVITDPDKTVNAFKWAVEEMEKRYRLFQQVGARNLADFNQKTDTIQLPYVLIVVDELADLMMFAANEMETLITRIAQKARATGIFMILSTQRPSVDVITGLIKANIPTRIALNVSSSTDSRVILDTIGAEKLLGKGDMLYLPPDSGKPKRIQSVFLSNQEISRITEYMKQFKPIIKTKIDDSSENINRNIELPSTNNDFDKFQEQSNDDKFIEAVKVILNYDKASASLLQRRLKIGYARAARILDELQEKGMVGAPDGSNPREVYIEKVNAYLQKQGISVSIEAPNIIKTDFNLS